VRADELYLKVRGNPKYSYALMDDQTRFWIAQQDIHLTYGRSLHMRKKSQKNDQTLSQMVRPIFTMPLTRHLR